MSIKNEKRVSLLRYWTTRYVITLCIGLVVIAGISAWWIRETTLNHRIDMLQLTAEEIATRFVDISEGQPVSRSGIQGFINERIRFLDFNANPVVYLAELDGTIVSGNRPTGPLIQKVPQSLIDSAETVQKILLENEQASFYFVKSPIAYNGNVIGWVVMIESEKNLTQVQQEYRLLSVMVLGLGLLGWLAIYFLSKRLSKPIQDVAVAAKMVQEGNYKIDLPENMKEKEVYELISSFKEMSARLQNLESLRTELLAGVTHELKTPVTAMSGLLQALNDGVVEGEDAKEFLRMSLNETAKMRKLVEDLLAFNSYATNAIPIVKENRDLNELIQETVRQWKVVNDNDQLTVHVGTKLANPLIDTDPFRVQQILNNLLNNAGHAIEGEGSIEVSLSEHGPDYTIDVMDSGSGIPEEEQDFIFERFFRGENKKLKVRGLGLGLPFSKMVAQSLGGDLTLVESSQNGTVFRIRLPNFSRIN